MDSQDKQSDNSSESATFQTPEISSLESGQDAQIGLEQIVALQNEDSKTENCFDEDDDIIDIDLSTVEVAKSVIDQALSLDDLDLNIPDNINQSYKKIMSLCSATAQDIKKSISDVLSSREGVVITEVDTTSELQASLNKKIADFEKAVSGCITPPNLVKESSPESSESHSVKITEIDLEEDKVEDNVAVNNSEENALKVVESSGTYINNIVKENDEKTASSPISKPSEKSETPVPSTKGSSTIPLQSPNSLKELLKNIAPAEEEKFAKKQRNAASKKKGEKNLDLVLKSLGNGTAEARLQLLCKRHVETLEELRLVEPRLKQLERQIISQQREKEQLQAEHNRMILAKSRLEGLCREMQRQSKAVKEESLLRIKEEEDKRKEIANKFQSTLNDISSLMQENSKKNIHLREENAELATKLKSLVDNYEVWEQNMSKIVQQKELEAQLAKAKHAKVNLLLKQETEKFLREKQSLLENLSELQKRCTLLTTNELQLRTELGDYTSKYEEFQSVISNSSKVFSTFKTDMETTSKKIKKLEKETNVYKIKWESSNKALLDMISHKEKQDKEVSNAQQRISTLEKLCRALQAERNELQNQINVMSSNAVSTTQTDVPSLSTEAGVA